VHETEQQAEAEVMTILNIYADLVRDELAIPVLTGKKTEREKFKGAVYTTTLEAMMPDGKALQMGTSHHLGQKFSIPFEIKYLGKDEKEHYAWTTSWGISWRLIGATILSHGDDRGLILPPKIAPIQVVIIPIYYKETDSKNIPEETKNLSSQLEKVGVRTLIDDRPQYTPGWKYHEWEMKGVPLRVEIGPKDIQAKQVTIVRRDSKEKLTVSRNEAKERINRILVEIQTHLFEKAKKSFDSLTTTVSDMESFKKILEGRGGFIKAFLSDESCEEKIKIETGATVRVVPMETSRKGNCVYCGAANSGEVYFARSY
jgi:prolyl-tRNA synthetase